MSSRRENTELGVESLGSSPACHGLAKKHEPEDAEVGEFAAISHCL